MTEPVEKPKMISLKEQLKRDTDRKTKKFFLRAMKRKPRVQETNIGNKDFGIPYKGKDRFSGQRKKEGDRIIREWVQEDEDGTTRVVNRLFVYDNNKYNGDGSLKA